MSEETISTTSEVAEVQTTPDAVEETQSVVEQPTTEVETTAEEPVKAETETEITKDWEKIAKDNQASFTRVSQELAELKKQIEANKPKIADDNGKMTPEYEKNYRFAVDNREFLTYDNLARQLEPETRAEVERLLREAQNLYSPNNKKAYEAKMAEVKDYFRADIVEQVALDKLNYENQMQSEFEKEVSKVKQAKADEIAAQIEGLPDVKELVYADSENYSPEVFGIVKQMFDLTGGIDLDMTQKAISKIKELGVKEYLAKQSVEKEAEKAQVPTGEAVIAAEDGGLPSRAELVADRGLYRKAVEKYGSETIDNIIMKG